MVDLSLLIPGPSCTENLAYLGAEVVKVEPPGGDPARQLHNGEFFELLNRGKRSIVLDLKDPDDRLVAGRLCAGADVVVESFRAGVAERLGVGYAAVAAGNPGVVYCSVTGYGSDSRRPGHDLSFLARGGALSVPGGWSSRDRPPTRPAIPIADFGGGAVATQAILAALLGRQRTGTGQYLDVAMQEVVLHWLAPRAGAAVRGEDPGDPTRHLEPANDVYATGDGRWLAVAAIESHLWAALCDALGDDVELPVGSRDWDWRRRRASGEELAAALREGFLRRPRDAWLARLEAAGVPVDPVATLVEAYTDPWVRTRGVVRDGWVRPPLPFDSQVGPAPELDADGAAIRAAVADGQRSDRSHG